MNRARLFDFCHGIPSLDVLFILLLATQAQHVIAGDKSPPSSTSDDNEDQPQPSFSPGMSVVLVFFICVFFLTAFISLYIRQCSGHRYRYSFPNRTNFFRRSPSTPARQRGLEPAVVNTFPTFLYSQVKGHRIGQRALECAVCLLEFEDDHKLRLLPICSHVFHPDCIDTWLALRVTCPVCRVNLVPKPGELITHVTCALCPQDLISSDLTESNSAPAGYGMGTGSGSADLNIDIIDDSTTLEHQTRNQNRPPRSTPRKPKNAGNKFHRSNSTGHSIVRLGDHNCERFTLRLPEDVRSQLMKKSPSTSSTATGVFLSVRSPRRGYRSSSVGTSHGRNYERFDSVGRSGVWNFRMTPPFVSQAGWVRSPADDLTATPVNLMRSVKSPLDRLFKGTDHKDDDGQRSNRRLIPDDQA